MLVITSYAVCSNTCTIGSYVKTSWNGRPICLGLNVLTCNGFSNWPSPYPERSLYFIPTRYNSFKPGRMGALRQLSWNMTINLYIYLFTYLFYIYLSIYLFIYSFLLTLWKYELNYPCTEQHTVYPSQYAHGFVVLCFVVVMQSFIMNSHEVLIHIHQGCFAGTVAIVRLPQCQWSKPDGCVKINQCITTTKHSKAKTCAYFWDILYMPKLFGITAFTKALYEHSKASVGYYRIYFAFEMQSVRYKKEHPISFVFVSVFYCAINIICLFE